MANCAVCGEAGIFVAERNVPDCGPLQIPGATIHRIDGDAVYHTNLDNTTHGTRLYP